MKFQINKTMKRKDYEKPAMRVVKIMHTGMLMTSGFGAGRSSYGSANNGVSSEELNNETGEWEWN